MGRALILDATEQLVVSEGYASVTTWRVAGMIGLTAALVHYYFATTDDLLVATSGGRWNDTMSVSDKHSSRIGRCTHYGIFILILIAWHWVSGSCNGQSSQRRALRTTRIVGTTGNVRTGT